MNKSELQSLIASGESETLEFKKTTGERREAMHALCAMLNHRGGCVLFGIDPAGKLIGQQVSDRTVEELAQEIQHIEPTVFPQIDKVVVGTDRHIVSIRISTGANRPYTYKGQAFRRVGNTNQKMTGDEYQRVLIERFHGERRWESEPLDGWTAKDLDSSELTRTVEEAIRRGRMEDPGTRAPLELLRGLGLVKDGTLLRAAAVLFGRAERLEAEFPQCLLRLAKFNGTDKNEFLDNQQFCGNAFYLLGRADRFIRENIPISGRIVPELFDRQDDPLYPPVALREALANAFCHRDYALGGGSVAVAVYQDRLEVTSSGSLHFGLTTEILFQPHESLPWNPLVARVFHRRGIIESWGRGTLKIAELSAKAGLPRPQIEDSGGCVVVRFLPGRSLPRELVAQDLTPRQQTILNSLSGGRRLAVRDMAATVGVSDRVIRKELALLRGLGLVTNDGHGRGSYWLRSDA